MLVASQRETGSPWSAVNCICHMLDGDESERSGEFSLRDSLIGIGSHAGAMFFWSILHELAHSRRALPISVLDGVSLGALAYLVDYRVVPKRLTPGIEKVLSKYSLLWVYLVLALTLGASPLWNRPDRV